MTLNQFFTSTHKGTIHTYRLSPERGKSIDLTGKDKCWAFWIFSSRRGGWFSQKKNKTINLPFPLFIIYLWTAQLSVTNPTEQQPFALLFLWLFWFTHPFALQLRTVSAYQIPFFFFLLHAVLIMMEQNNSRKIWLALLSGAFHLSSFVSFDVCRALCRKEMLRTRQSVDAWCCFSQRVINTYNISTRFVSFLTHFSNLVDSNLRIQMRN